MNTGHPDPLEHLRALADAVRKNRFKPNRFRTRPLSRPRYLSSDITCDEFARGPERGYPYSRWYQDDFASFYLLDALNDPRFSARDHDILMWMYDGADVSEIAVLLSLEVGTARTVVWRVCRRAQLILVDLLHE